MMGDWSGNDTSSAEGAITKNTGIYGFQKGVASFGFRDDGTAFIGKPGAGRLNFDGSKSTITSNWFEADMGGMQLDFSDGLIEMQNPIRIYWTGNFGTTAGWPKKIKATRELREFTRKSNKKLFFAGSFWLGAITFYTMIKNKVSGLDVVAISLVVTTLHKLVNDMLLNKDKDKFKLDSLEEDMARYEFILSNMDKI
jgi:hypothetical protein